MHLDFNQSGFCIQIRQSVSKSPVSAARTACFFSNNENDF